jgi:FMN-dependent NADH-azoreductase
MTTLLQINTSLYSNGGQSSQLANRFVANWTAQHPDANVVVRDVAADPVPHLDGERFGAFLAKPEERTPEQQAVVAYSDQLIGELQNADVIVLGLPMYNFGIPSTLKAWIDHVARGGKYVGTPLDSQTDYIRAFFGFLGMTDVEFVYAEGLAMGEAPKQAALSQAHQQLEKLAA